MIKDAIDFLEFARGTRPDFHEPDEQGIKFIACIGTRLDNAMGDHVDPDRIAGNYQEVVLFLRREEERNYTFNLATLLALAKRGAESLVTDTERGKCQKLS